MPMQQHEIVQEFMYTGVQKLEPTKFFLVQVKLLTWLIYSPSFSKKKISNHYFQFESIKILKMEVQVALVVLETIFDIQAKIDERAGFPTKNKTVKTTSQAKNKASALKLAFLLAYLMI